MKIINKEEQVYRGNVAGDINASVKMSKISKDQTKELCCKKKYIEDSRKN